MKGEKHMNNHSFDKLQYNELKNIVKEYCVSNLGKEHIDHLTPSTHKATIKNRLAETTEGRTLLDLSGSVPLQGIMNISNILDKVEKGSILEPEALTNIQSFILGCQKMKTYLKDKDFYAPILYSYSNIIEDLHHVVDEIDSIIKNGKIDDNASKELKIIRRYITNTEIKIEDRLDRFLKSSDNKTYIQEFFVSKRNGRYTIPIKAAYKNQVPGTIVDTSSKGLTVFIEPMIISKYTTELLQLKTEESIEEYRLLTYLTGIVYDEIHKLKRNAEVIAQYDMIFAKAKYSKAIDGIEPKINDYGLINIIKGRHPLLSGKVVPLYFEIGKDYRTLIITGPNAGGKTLVLKTIGLLTLAMQSGFHIPAEKGSEMSVFDKIYVDIGDDQSIENALSTFSSHVKNIAEILKNANKATLLLFDEIGSGTEPNEGAALAIAILEAAYHKGALTVATTHYAEIKNYANLHPDFTNAAMRFNKETLEPLYQLVIGTSGESNALWISKRMGIDQSILDNAKNYMTTSKNYNLKYVNSNNIRINKEAQSKLKEDNLQYDFQKGDQVILTEYNDYGIVYEGKDEHNNVKVLYKNEFIDVNVKRLKLSIEAKYLYPKDYDFDILFKSYKERKLEKDILRGSKKALKAIRKQEKAERYKDNI
jgi:DNA mismatch repair protein MutS2